MKYLIKISDGHIYGYSEMLAKRNDMREPTTRELDSFFNVVATQEKDEPKNDKQTQEFTDDDVKEWAKVRAIDNDKETIYQYGLAKYTKKLSKSFSTLNMLRELMAIDNESI